MLHHQLETIHPFTDGNGRVGRLLIPLQMVHEGVLSQPWLYLSAELERRKPEYVDALLRVRTKNAVADWLRFFIEVVGGSARAMLTKLEALTRLREEYENRITGYRSDTLFRTLPLLFESPVLTIPRVAEHLGVDVVPARKVVLQLEKRRILRRFERPTRTGRRGRPPYAFICDEIVAIVKRA